METNFKTLILVDQDKGLNYIITSRQNKILLKVDKTQTLLSLEKNLEYWCIKNTKYLQRQSLKHCYY